jgi:phage recombination protein Bet
MNNQLAKIEYTQDEVKLIKSQIAPKANDNELKLFLYQCQRTGLDPLTRQIYAIHRKSGNEEKMTIQTSIDGFRVIAERSGVYAGQSEPEFIHEGDGLLKCCKITVRKFAPNGQIYDAAVGVAFWDEYVQQKDEWKNGQKTGKKIVTEMWSKMPHTMLSKVAEALALRKAFPQDLSGLYTADEMQQAEQQQVTVDTTYTEEKGEVIAVSDKVLLFQLLTQSTLEPGTEDYEKAWKAIDTCTSYKVYEKLHARLEQLQKGYDDVVNASAKDINKKLKAVQS